MKRLFALLQVFIIPIIFISCSTSPEWSGTFDYYPEKPEPGDEITVFYNTDSTKLASQDSIEMIVYLYSIKLDNTLGVEMKKNNKGWEGRIKTDKDTRGLLIKFKDEDVFDNNEKKGYVIHLYDGENFVPGSIAGLGGAVLNWGSYYLDLERDFKLSVKFFEEDFNNNPDIKHEYLDAYLMAYSQVYPELSDSVVKSELIKLESKENLTEKNLAVLSDWYGKTGDMNKAEKYKNILSEKFPHNENIQLTRYREIQAEQDIGKRIEFVDKFEKGFPESKYLNSAYDLIAIYYRDNEMYDKALDFFQENSNKTTVFRFYSVTQKMFKENSDPETALQIARLGVERGERELVKPSGKKPEYLSEKEWKEELKLYTGLNYFSYGKALYLKGNIKEAENNLQKAVELTKNQDGEINEMYVTAVYKNGDNTKTKEIIEDYIEDGKSTSPMTDILKEIYITEKGSEDGFENYLSQFHSVALKELEAKFKSEMINKPAPDFTLEDLKGEKFSLADFKGKTIVVDFWATWCGPCLSSFPGMKKAVEKYSDNEDVKFLFINSWERVDNKKNNAEDFIKTNNYPFHVLMDYDNKVIGDFGVSGIPTKFIVDRNGSIRFMSVGYSGNNDQLVDELSVMIDLVN